MSHKPPISPRSSLWDNRVVGLLGGSFNPAHAGHKHIAEEALKRLDIDAVWLMVSPSNPLKTDDDMAALDARIESAEAIATHAKVMVTDIENDFGTNRTFDSILALFDAFPKTHFVWIMGADNMQQFSSWYRWEMIAENLPIAIFDRPSYSNGGLGSDLARKYAKFRVSSKHIATSLAPAWSFVTIARHTASATEIRRSPGFTWPANKEKE